MTKHFYKLKLKPQTIKYLKQIKKRYKINLHVGSCKDFYLSEFNIPPGVGYYFEYKRKHFIYVNDYLPYKNGHDLVVLHEVGHFLLKEHKFKQQEEAFANGFAFAMATQLGIKTSKNIIKDMEFYSKEAFLRAQHV